MLGSNPESASDSEVRAGRLRDARIAAARRAAWEEIPEERLVARQRWLVDLETSRAYSLYRGAVFETSTAAIIPDRNPGLVFYIDPDGRLTVLERAPRTIEVRLAKR